MTLVVRRCRANAGRRRRMRLDLHASPRRSPPRHHHPHSRSPPRRPPSNAPCRPLLRSTARRLRSERAYLARRALPKANLRLGTHRCNCQPTASSVPPIRVLVPRSIRQLVHLLPYPAISPRRRLHSGMRHSSKPSRPSPPRSQRKLACRVQPLRPAPDCSHRLSHHKPLLAPSCVAPNRRRPSVFPPPHSPLAIPPNRENACQLIARIRAPNLLRSRLPRRRAGSANSHSQLRGRLRHPRASPRSPCETNRGQSVLRRRLKSKLPRRRQLALRRPCPPCAASPLPALPCPARPLPPKPSDGRLASSSRASPHWSRRRPMPRR